MFILHHRNWLLAKLFILSIGVSVGSAQHVDILVDVVDGKLTVNEPLALADFRGGLSEGDILEVNNPGYATQRAHQLEPGTLLSFDVLGPLLYSNGAEWQPATSNAYFESVRPGVENHYVAVTGQTSRQSGFPLAQADSQGVFHEHIRFRLGSEDEGPPPDGFYAVQKVLTSSAYDNSEPFLLIFKNGLDTRSFIQSVVSARQLIADSKFDCSGDGLLTTDDLACVSEIDQRDSVLRSIGSVAGDLDGDGAVDFSDFLMLSQNFGTQDADYTSGNIDLVGEVDFSDFLIFSLNFGFNGPTHIATIPESASANMRVAALVVCVVFCHRTRTKRGNGQKSA